MILIFGGTTEGRTAASVCEGAGKTFFYSTKSDMQQVELHHGVRLSGGMTAEEMRAFCKSHGICCIIDAAHPFAVNLHKAIYDCARMETDSSGRDIPVIRMQRSFAEKRNDVTYCDDYADAIKKMQDAHIRCLLALSGVNTVKKLKPYWTHNKTVFRILDREESIASARENGISDKNIIFYNDENALPSTEEETKMMRSVGCDAIITKDSGASGGFNAKVDAAVSLGLKVFVVKHPELPKDWTYATGKYGLRRAIEKLAPQFFPLKTGLTTGACATAAAKAATMSLLGDDAIEEVSFALPDGEILTIPVELSDRGRATVVKDMNDDPDVTKGCRITARAEFPDYTEGTAQVIAFLKGNGVGTVTLPGIGIPVGGPAVNPTPRKMIMQEIKGITHKSVNITISVENGKELAKKTFNPRVGVVGGISILGTSGIVHPLSNEAFIKSIRRELDVAWAMGCKEIGLVAGMKSERALKEKVPGLRCVHYGNFIGESLKAAREIGFSHVYLAIMIGKAVKLAEGHLDTHSHKFVMNKDFLIQTATELGLDSSRIKGITMARELWDFMPDEFFERIKSLCIEHCKEVFPEGELTIKLICDKQQ